MTIYFDSLTDFIAMGGHGVYIWFCYIIVLVALVFQAGLIRTSFKRVKKNLRRYYQKLDSQAK